MNTDVWKIRALVTSRLIVIVAACCLLAGCDDGPTGPSTRIVPTPVLPNVAGSWRGRFHPGGPVILCGEDVPAAATFSQDGPRFTGTVTTTRDGSPRTSQFVGELQGAQFTGTLNGGGNPIRVSGTASSTNMTMRYGRENTFCQTPTFNLFR